MQNFNELTFKAADVAELLADSARTGRTDKFAKAGEEFHRLVNTLVKELTAMSQQIDHLQAEVAALKNQPR